MGQLRHYTLVELLVTVSVISILVAMLLPALTQAKQMAVKTKCTNNMRQIGTNLTMYADGNEGYLFPSQDRSAGSFVWWMYNAKYGDYAGVDISLGMHNCPIKTVPGESVLPVEGTAVSNTYNIAINTSFTTNWNTGDAEFVAPRAMPLRVSRPDRNALIADGQASGQFGLLRSTDPLEHYWRWLPYPLLSSAHGQRVVHRHTHRSPQSEPWWLDLGRTRTDGLVRLRGVGSQPIAVPEQTTISKLWEGVPSAPNCLETPPV